MYFKKDFFITLIFSVGLLLSSLSVNAIPARPTPFTVVQANGEEVTLRIYGDEYFNYKTTLDGYIVNINEDNNYCYVILDELGNVIVSSIIAHDPEKRSIEEKMFIEKLDSEQILRALKESKSERKNAYKRSAPSKTITHKKKNFPTKGEVRTIAILIEFPNIPFKVENPQEAFYNLLNEPGYNVNGTTGSAKDYFIENSGGTFTPHFDVYGPVRMSRESGYYIKNTDHNRVYMAGEACTILSESGEVDFSLYDSDNDGVVDNIYLFCSGYNAADGADGGIYVWPHSYNVDTLNLVLNGKKISSYACSTELMGKSDITISSIGNFVHEFGHVLGLPDFYTTTSGLSAPTPGDFSVMDYGCYNNDQRTPANLSAYERYCLGWNQPIELNDQPLNVGIRNLADSNESYLIKTSVEDEFFVLENRQQKGWDEYLPGHGMLIWHIDYDEAVWEKNEVNNTPEHQRVHLIEADEWNSAGTYDGDPFPGANNVTEFTDNSSPAMKTWNGEILNKGLTEIKEVNGNIYFRFKDGILKNLTDKVEALPATEIDEISFVANWNVYEDNIFGYVLELSYWTGNEWELVNEYLKKDIGNGSHYIVTDLEAGTEYKYRIAATDGFSTTEYSNEITVKTKDAVTFEYIRPEVSTYSITGENFVINWKSIAEATSYLVEVYQKEYTDPEESILLDFTDKLETVNKLRWTSDANTLIIPEGYYGKATPSLRFDQHGRYLESPVYDMPITYLSFWYAGRNNSSQDAVVLKGYTKSGWTELWRKDNLNEEKEQIGDIIEFTSLDLNDCYAISIVYERISGSQGVLFLDDLKLEYGSELVYKEIITENISASDDNSKLSFKVDNVEKNQYYYYTVTGLSENSQTRISKEIEVFTDEFSAVEEINDNYSDLIVTTESIYVKVNTNLLNQIEIYNLMGVRVYTSTFYNEIRVYTNNLSKGIYLIKVNREVHKVIIR